jgi:hypothetical protein
MLLLQHIHFTIQWRDKHDCTLDQLTHDWVKLPSAPLVCGVRRCCQVFYMVVTSILLVISLLKILSQIFFIRPRIHPLGCHVCVYWFLVKCASLRQSWTVDGFVKSGSCGWY